MTKDMTRREALRAGVGALVIPSIARDAWRELQLPRFARNDSASADADLDVALKAARWIRRSQIETPEGLTWPADPLKPESIETDLYNGMPGVLLFHLELYHATHDRAWLDVATAGAKELASKLPAMDASGDCGLYTGLAGAAWVLEETHRASGDGQFRDSALRALSMIHARAERAGSGVAWGGADPSNDIISGSAGIGLLLLWAAREMGHAPSVELARAAGARLVEVAQPAKGGLKWAAAPSVKNLYPNFSHGTAGVGYFLASLHEVSGDRAHLDAALSGAKYLEGVANTEANGFKVFHHEPGGEELYYLAWCHGPAGTSRLFHQLTRATQDDRWSALVRRGAAATMASGIPEHRTPGFWNNISQCCGNCGAGEYFLSLQQLGPKAEYAEMVRRFAEDTLRRSTVDGDGLKWAQAENRVSPEDVVAQTGYMQGAAGVGALFLHKEGAGRGVKRAIVWPDAPVS